MGTYRFIFKLNKSLQYLRDNRCPCCNIFGLGIHFELREVLEYSKSQALERQPFSLIVIHWSKRRSLTVRAGPQPGVVLPDVQVEGRSTYATVRGLE